MLGRDPRQERLFGDGDDCKGNARSGRAGFHCGYACSPARRLLLRCAFVPQATSEVTDLLLAWSRGEEQALERLMPLVVDELRHIAARYLDREGREHTLQPTALVNELYMKLTDRRSVQWKNRSQFFGVAAEMMRHILVDYARARRTGKRGKDQVKISLDSSLNLAEKRDVEILALDEALKELAKLDPRQAKIVELRFFTGLTHEEIGGLLGVSETTIKREWKTARLWLYEQMRQP